MRISQIHPEQVYHIQEHRLLASYVNLRGEDDRTAIEPCIAVYNHDDQSILIGTHCGKVLVNLISYLESE